MNADKSSAFNPRLSAFIGGHRFGRFFQHTLSACGTVRCAILGLMETVGFYAFAGIVIAIPAGLIFFVASRAHRVCKSRTWPRVVALGIAFVYILVTIAPFALYGSQWGMAWFLLTMPFSLVLEVTAPMGIAAFTSITSIIAASFWGTVLYVVFAIILLVRERTAPRVH